MFFKMMKLKTFFSLILIFLIISACQTVSNKIEDTTFKEQQELSRWLNESEKSLKKFFGQPDKIDFLKTGNRNYIYSKKKLRIKCERKFEINQKNIVVGFSSKNCF